MLYVTIKYFYVFRQASLNIHVIMLNFCGGGLSEITDGLYFLRVAENPHAYLCERAKKVEVHPCGATGAATLTH
jgi:hypothetical protein